MRFTNFCLTIVLLAIADLLQAQEQPVFTSATISGLGARNIGSAAMSGRISAIAGNHEPSGKLPLFVGAASGGVWKLGAGGPGITPSSTSRKRNRSARSRSIRQTRKMFGSAPANVGRATVFRSATEF